jgi:hypothetical protein
MKKVKIYNNRWRGEEISEYGLELGYIDYRCLAECVGNMVLNNTLINIESDYWEIISGSDKHYYDNNNNEISEDEYFNHDEYDGNYNYVDVFQFYIITDYAAEFLSEHTNEIIYYNSKLDIHLWGVTHYGTSWDYVLTNIEIERDSE